MKAAWQALRIVRWALWAATVAYYAHFFVYRQAHLTQFGHLMMTTELWMFGLPIAAVFAGFFELMARERVGLPRPAIGRNWGG